MYFTVFDSARWRCLDLIYGSLLGSTKTRAVRSGERKWTALKSNRKKLFTRFNKISILGTAQMAVDQHLLYKLKYYGISCNAYDWISDFLTDRTQTVVGLLEGEMSSKAPVTSGVPQGTVLGPILFLIYINDFPEYLQHSTLRLFADDSIIYKEIKTINDAQHLQLDLDAACRWEKDWLMHFHPDKCNLISIT